MDALKLEVKKVIIAGLELEDLTPDDIADDEALFGDDGLGLDSVDALELGVAIKKSFGITFSGDKTENKKYFYSVNTLADYIKSQKENA